MVSSGIERKRLCSRPCRGAVSDTPAGPYRFIRSGRVNAGKLPVNMDGQAVAVLDTLNAKNYEKWWTPEWTDAVNKGLIVKRDWMADRCLAI